MAYPYAFASLLYTWGMYCSVVASGEALRKIEVEQGRLSHALPSEAAGMHTEAPCRQSSRDHVRYVWRLTPKHVSEIGGLLDVRGCHVYVKSMYEVAFGTSLESGQLKVKSSCRNPGIALPHKAAVRPPCADPCAVEETPSGSSKSSEVLKSALSSEHAWATLDLSGGAIYPSDALMVVPLSTSEVHL